MAESVEERAALEIMAPLLPKTIVNELCSGRKYIPYLERKRQLRLWRIECAWWRQRRMAEEIRQTEYQFVDGLGQRKAIVDPVIEYETGNKYGRHSWHDADHLDFILKRHPELRVPSPKPRFHMVNGFKKENLTGDNRGNGDNGKLT